MDPSGTGNLLAAPREAKKGRALVHHSLPAKPARNPSIDCPAAFSGRPSPSFRLGATAAATTALPPDSAVEPVILVDRVSKRYGTTLAVRELSFSVGKGEVLGFLGPNGAGKTTTMRVITGFMPPTEGRVLVAGLDLAEAPLEARRKIGYLPEHPPLYPEMEVDSFLEFAARLRGVGRHRLRQAVDRAAEQCGLADAGDRIIGKLSRGYRQRVGLAQALVHDPEVLVLDEPTAGLDPKQIHETRGLIRMLARDRTVVLSTHILSEVTVTCDRVVIISRGRLRAEDAPERLAARLASAREGSSFIEIETAASANAAAEALARVSGVASVDIGAETAEGSQVLQVEVHGNADRRSELARAVLDAGSPLLGLRRGGASLEDVFLELTEEEGAGQSASGAADAAVGTAGSGDRDAGGETP